MYQYAIVAQVQAKDENDEWVTVYGIEPFIVEARAEGMAKMQAMRILLAGIAVYGGSFTPDVDNARIHIDATLN